MAKVFRVDHEVKWKVLGLFALGFLVFGLMGFLLMHRLQPEHFPLPGWWPSNPGVSVNSCGDYPINAKKCLG